MVNSRRLSYEYNLVVAKGRVMQEWDNMSWEEKERWAKQASDEQLKKIQHEGLNF